MKTEDDTVWNGAVRHSTHEMNYNNACHESAHGLYYKVPR